MNTFAFKNIRPLYHQEQVVTGQEKHSLLKLWIDPIANRKVIVNVRPFNGKVSIQNLYTNQENKLLVCNESL